MQLGTLPPGPRDLALWCCEQVERGADSAPLLLTTPGQALGSVPTVALSSPQVKQI